MSKPTPKQLEIEAAAERFAEGKETLDDLNLLLSDDLVDTPKPNFRKILINKIRRLEALIAASETTISLRDHFAAQAMNGVLSALTSDDVADLERVGIDSHKRIEYICRESYEIADAMLNKRENI